MKRYLLFWGGVYYPNGGMEDFVEDFDNYVDASLNGLAHHEKECCYSPKEPEYFENYWMHLYDTKEGKIIDLHFLLKANHEESIKNQ